MKKAISLFLALTLVLGLSVTAFATDLPSKTTSDLTRFDVVAENQPEDTEIYLLPVNEATVKESLPDYQERVDICVAEQEKLAEAESVVSYFTGLTDLNGQPVDTSSEAVTDAEGNVVDIDGNVVKLGIITDMDGNEVNIKEILGLAPDEEPQVFEFCPAIAGGFQEDCGKVTASMLFPTPYEEGETVVVMIGIVTTLKDGSQVIVWKAFEGVGMGAVEDAEETYGCIKVEFPPEIVNAIQNETALMAVISK